MAFSTLNIPFGMIYYQHMKAFPLHLLLLALLSFTLNSCYSSVCLYTWNRAKVAEATWIPEPDAAELYRVGENVYVKGCRGKVRGCQEGEPFHSLLGHDSISTWEPISDENETVYLKVRDDIAKRIRTGGIYVLEHRGDYILTDLPAHAELLPGKGKLKQVKTRYQHRRLREPRLCSSPRADAHAFYAYPVGALTAVVVDVPCTVVMNAGALVAGTLYLPYYLYDSFVNRP